MKKLLFGIVFIFILFPTTQSFSQEYTDTNPTLIVSTNSNTNYVYQDSEGHTVVIGIIENNDPLSFVTNVKVQAYFYDELNPEPLEVNEGSTILASVYLAFYDVFDRIIQVSKINVGTLGIDELTSIKLTEEINSSSVGFVLFSESDKFYSDTINLELPSPQFNPNLPTTCNSNEVSIGGNCTSYDISGGHITSATVNLDDNSVIINIHADDDGVLTISPSESTQRGIFMVLVDGEESDDAETIAAMILAVAIISIVAISAKSRLSIVPRY